MNFLMDITPRCDCCSFAGKPLVNDIGIFASKDAVAIDRACYDMVCEEYGKDIFYEFNGVDGRIQIEEGCSMGMGKGEYIIKNI